MSFRLAEADLEALKAALKLLNAARDEHGVDLCAYGGIDVEISSGGHLRLEHVEGVGYVFAERYT